MTQNSLNDIAQNRFEELRKKMRLNFQDQIKEKKPELTQEKLDELTNPKHVLTRKETIELNKDGELNNIVSKAEEVDEMFDYINSLQLPPQLSLIVGLIISGHKSDNLDDLNRAWCELKDFTAEVWNIKYGQRKETTNS